MHGLGLVDVRRWLESGCAKVYIGHERVLGLAHGLLGALLPLGQVGLGEEVVVHGLVLLNLFLTRKALEGGLLRALCQEVASVNGGGVLLGELPLIGVHFGVVEGVGDHFIGGGGRAIQA